MGVIAQGERWFKTQKCDRLLGGVEAVLIQAPQRLRAPWLRTTCPCSSTSSRRSWRPSRWSSPCRPVAAIAGRLSPESGFRAGASGAHRDGVDNHEADPANKLAPPTRTETLT